MCIPTSRAHKNVNIYINIPTKTISAVVLHIKNTSEDVKRIFIAHMKEHTEKFTQMPATYFK